MRNVVQGVLKRKQQGGKRFLIWALLLAIFVGMISAFVRLPALELKAAGIDLKTSSGSYKMTELEHVGFSQAYMVPTAALDRLKRIYSSKIPLWESVKSGGSWQPKGFRHSRIGGEYTFCSNPTVMAAPTYNNKKTLSANSLTGGAFRKFIQEFQSYHYPSLTGELREKYGEDGFFRRTAYVYLSGLFQQDEVTGGQIDQVFDLWKKVKKSVPNISKSDLKNADHTIYFTWHYSIDVELMRLYGGGDSLGLDGRKVANLTDFFDFVIEQILAEKISLIGPAINIYNVPTQGPGLFYSSAQTMNSFAGSLQVVQDGNLSLIKSSLWPDLTSRNKGYSLQGAVYQVYKDKSLTKEVGKLTTGADGKSNLLTGLEAGRYYVKEVQSPASFELDPTIHELELEAGKTTNLEVKDRPKFASIDCVLEKQDKETGKNQARGEASLEGAEFSLKFYPGSYASDIDPAEQSIKPERTWILKTDRQGQVKFRSDYKVSGDDFYQDGDGNVGLPLGLLTIQEVKAPEGYELNPEIFIRRMGLDSPATTVLVYNKINQPEQIIQNKFSVEKYTSENYKSEELVPEEAAEFTAISQGQIDKYGSFKEALKHKDQLPWGEWSSLITDSQGKGISDNLVYGKYILRQTAGPAGTELLEDELALVIDSSESEPVNFVIKNVPQEYYVRIIKKDSQTGERIILTGASFKIKDAEGNYVSQKVGSKTYDIFKTTAQVQEDLLAGSFYAVGETAGTTVTPLKLKAGSYSLEEVASPRGYMILDGPINFEVKAEKAIKPEGENDEYIELVAENTPQFGQLILHKQGEIFQKWADAETSLKVQLEGQSESREIEKERSNEALILKRSWLEPVDYEELVDTGSGENSLDRVEFTGIYKEDAFKGGQRKEARVSRQTLYTDEDGQVRLDLSWREDALEEKLEIFYRGKLLAAFGGEEYLDRDLADLIRDTDSDTVTLQLKPEINEEEVKNEGQVIEKNFKYKSAVYETDYLSGTTFSLIAQEDILSMDGQTLFYKKGERLLFAQKDIFLEDVQVYQKGDVITIPYLPEKILEDKEMVADSIVTEGKPLMIDKIPLGNYQLAELKAASGYIRDEGLRDFSFTAQEAQIKVDLKETEMLENRRQKIGLRLKKELEEGENYEYIVVGIYTGQDILGLPKDSLVAVDNPDSEGVVTVADLPAGSYYVKEISTADGYLLSSEEFELTLNPDPEAREDKIEQLERPLFNAKARKNFTIVKRDKVTDRPLTGVEFQLYRVTKTGEKILIEDDQGQARVFTTDEQGQIIIENLAYGNYYLEELKAPLGYILEKTGSSFAVAKNSREQSSIYNETTSIAISKVDEQTGLKVVGAKLRLIDREGETVYVDENGYVSSPDKGKPAEWISDGTDYIVHGLDVNGEYLVEEVEPAEGYHKKIEKVGVVVSESKGIQLTEISNQPYQPKIKTKAFVGDGLKETHALSSVQIRDLVDYQELIVGKKYRAQARLVLTSQPDQVVAEADLDFIPENSNGQLQLDFGQVNLKNYAGQILVVFENIIDLETKLVVAKHEDVSDQDQQVKVKEPELETMAHHHNGQKLSDPLPQMTAVDLVSYNNLIAGEAYQVRGMLVDREQPDKVISHAETHFIAEKEAGNVEVKFDFDGSDSRGKNLVVFEHLVYADETIFKHEDLDNKKQTITVGDPEIKTEAKIDGQKAAKAGPEMEIVDKVSYQNLTVGSSYRLEGVLVNKATGQVIKNDDQPVMAEKKFVAEAKQGDIEVSFTIDGTKLAGQELVVFEKLVHESGIVVASHADLNDADQTVMIEEAEETEKGKKPETSKKTKAKKAAQKEKKPTTNDNSLRAEVYLLAGFASLALAAIFLVHWFYRKRQKEK